MTSGKLITFARPYAIAAFDYAEESNVVELWATFLDRAATYLQQAEVVQLLSTPQLDPGQLADFVCGLFPTLSADQKNFINLLGEKKRLALLPDIAILFNELKATKNKTVEVQCISAVSLSADFKQQLQKNLSQRLKRQVILECDVDSTLIGGAIIKANNRVIDGSIRGKLNRLRELSLR